MPGVKCAQCDCGRKVYFEQNCGAKKEFNIIFIAKKNKLAKLRRHASRVLKLLVEKVWAQLTNSRDQLSHQIGYPFFFFFFACPYHQIGYPSNFFLPNWVLFVAKVALFCLERPRPIDRTPGITGSGKKLCLKVCDLKNFLF